MRALVKYWRNSVIKRRIKLHRFGAISIGLSAACLALACGNDNPSDDTPDEPDVVDECEINPYLEDCGGNEGPPAATGGTGGMVGGGGSGAGPVDAPPEEDLERAQVENILRANCGACHGSQLNELT